MELKTKDVLWEFNTCVPTAEKCSGHWTKPEQIPQNGYSGGDPTSFPTELPLLVYLLIYTLL